MTTQKDKPAGGIEGAVPDLSALASMVSSPPSGSALAGCDLQFGAMYWIPEDDTGFTRKGERPYVIVASQVPGQPTALVCPTTTVNVNGRGDCGLVIPSRTLLRLPRESVVLIGRTYPVHRRLFADYRFIGVLPGDLVEALRAARRGLAVETRRRSEAP